MTLRLISTRASRASPVRCENRVSSSTSRAMTAREDEILIERKHAWSIVQLNRPRALNALTTGMLNKLQEVYMQAEATADSAVLLKGAGCVTRSKTLLSTSWVASPGNSDAAATLSSLANALPLHYVVTAVDGPCALAGTFGESCRACKMARPR